MKFNFMDEEHEIKFIGATTENETDDTPSSTNGDYSPSCPWNAPGMSIHDFI